MEGGYYEIPISGFGEGGCHAGVSRSWLSVLHLLARGRRIKTGGRCSCGARTATSGAVAVPQSGWNTQRSCHADHRQGHGICDARGARAGAVDVEAVPISAPPLLQSILSNLPATSGDPLDSHRRVGHELQR